MNSEWLNTEWTTFHGLTKNLLHPCDDMFYIFVIAENYPRFNSTQICVQKVTNIKKILTLFSFSISLSFSSWSLASFSFSSSFSRSCFPLPLVLRLEGGCRSSASSDLSEGDGGRRVVFVVRSQKSIRSLISFWDTSNALNLIGK